ncbi:GntR family transcriptional regulator [Leucobacter chromiireducens]|uniref:GntR family transcriptional regulator n=1 Tax=Leucobacter chromiireducens TaxID=283877 RepID=UPI000F635F7E|nr:GntR family transcriptional regulator [Leucobacter chromiireducens]
MTARPARSISASERVASDLRLMILAGEILPGERIVQEDLAERFGASRLPVRDALRLLEAEGLVTLVANTGAWVAKLSLEECEEVYQIRERVEPLLLRMSVPGLNPAVISRLHELVVAMRETDSIEEFLRLDRDFHSLSYSGAQTGMLGDFVARLWNTTQHYRRAFSQIYGVHTNRAVHLEHELLVLAIERGDVDEAERIMGAHIRRTRLSLAQHPEIFQETSALS